MEGRHERMQNTQESMDKLLHTALENFCKQSTFKWKRLQRVNYFKKIMNERRLMLKIKMLIDEIQPYIAQLESEELHGNSPAIVHIKQSVIHFMKKVDDERLLFDYPFLNYFIEQGYLEVAESFIVKAKKDDPDLSHEEIFQALRNVWIMNSLQLFWGIPLSLTPAIYAYSMLYPYTDNYLDHPDINAIDKIQFNYHLDQVIAGNYRKTSHERMKRITELVQEIEGQYSRTDYPQVFKSIEYIQDAQVKSMKQSDLKPMTQKELLNVSFYKGGHSVLADAFLVKPDLTSDDMQFAFQYGAFLQLIDDLQDVKEDIRSKNRTYFNFKTTPSESDVKVEKLITYLFEVNDINDTDSTKQKIIKTVIRSSSLLLIMEAVSKNQSYISSDFYATLETYSKVRLSFYSKVQKELQPLLNK